MVGYGIMFIIGVPFTSMTQIVPFIMFGIGLDDAFIIWGAYQQMDRSIPVLDRVHDTMKEVGVSIFVKTFTSVVAFALGSLSKVPAVYWLCYYAAPTIFIDFIYQMTFFVALHVIVLDEQRVEAKKRDCFICLKAPERVDYEVPEGTMWQAHVYKLGSTCGWTQWSGRKMTINSRKCFGGTEGCEYWLGSNNTH